MRRILRSAALMGAVAIGSLVGVGASPAHAQWGPVGGYAGYPGGGYGWNGGYRGWGGGYGGAAWCGRCRGYHHRHHRCGGGYGAWRPYGVTRTRTVIVNQYPNVPAYGLYRW
jgi:hypothetical protein